MFSCMTMEIEKENRSWSTPESSVEVVVPTILKPMDIAEMVQEQNENDSIANEHPFITESSLHEFTGNGASLNTTSSEFESSTEESDSEIDDIHSNFNSAIIPAAAVFVVMVIICIKCCKWFRNYTKEGDKDDKFYAVSVTDDEKEYDHVDITSESASTVYYDTLSSFASFCKRSGIDSTLSSIRAWCQENIKTDNFISSTPTADKEFINNELDIKPFNSKCNTRTQMAETKGDFDVRISSTSSADTVSEQLNDSPAIRRNNRFRASFETETRPSAFEYRYVNGNVKHEKLVRSNMKKSSTSTSIETTSPCSISEKPPEDTKLVDVGTQTNKSFRYSIRMSKGHDSNSDLDEMLFFKPSTNTLVLQSEESQRKDIIGNNLSENSYKTEVNKHVKYLSFALEQDRKGSHLTNVSEISKYPLDTNVEVIPGCKQTKESDEDLDDDVFIEETIIDSSQQFTKTQQLNTNTSSNICTSIAKCNEENLFVGLTHYETYLCSHCTTKICRNIGEPTSDDTGLQISDINSVIQMLCEKCKREYKQKVSSKTETDQIDALPLQNMCKFAKNNDRSASTFSLESSGFAELSSSERSSNSP